MASGNSVAAAATTRLGFDEDAYLATYPDVLVSIETREFEAAQDHYERHGRREGRVTAEAYIQALGLLPKGVTAADGAVMDLDTIVVSEGGTVLVVGWTDDREAALHSVSIFASGEHAWHTTSFSRVRRGDVEGALQAAPGHLFGYWVVAQLAPGLDCTRPWSVRTRLANGRFAQKDLRPRTVSDADMRGTILGYFAAADLYGNRQVESVAAFETGIGAALVDLNRRVVNHVTAGAWASYYGPAGGACIGSIIVCLFGKPEFLFVQCALFSAAPRAREYEYIFVSNSPELTETLVKEARICGQIYGLRIVLVCLPDNAGFGAANNAAARFARSNRLLITNPDVFPRDNGWAQRHADIVDGAPAAQTKLFGAPLYYDDGSLMHHGMYFEVDAGISVRPDGIATRPMYRTEHYGKGAPVWSRQFICPRPVPAITGAFMSADRDWYETLGGFTEDYLFGHYEDADLSLKSLSRGVPVWVQDLPLWHMEGKGSVRRAAHEGGILVNRWLFSRQWGDFIAAELNGPNPSCALLALPSDTPILQPAA